MRFTAGVVVGAVSAGVAVWAAVSGREAAVQDREYLRGFDEGHAIGWIEGREHGMAERPPGVRALDSAFASGRELERARRRENHPPLGGPAPWLFADRN